MPGALAWHKNNKQNGEAMNHYLVELRIEGFKSIDKEFVFAPKKASAKVYGYTGTGKTTIKDAFLWLLTGKDSEGRAAFDIIPHTNPDATPSVMAVMEKEGGESISLSRSLKRKFKKNRSTGEKEFSGWEKVYGVGADFVKETEFVNTIETWFGVTAETISLLIDSRKFNTMDMAKRRELLLAIANVSHEDVILAGGQDLAGFVVGKSIGAMRKQILGDLRSLSDSLTANAAKKKENRDRLPAEDPNVDDSEEERLKKKLEELQQDKASVAAGSNRHLLDQLSDLRGARQQIVSENERMLLQRDNELAGQRHQLNTLELKRDMLQNERNTKSAEVGRTRETLNQLTLEYQEAKDATVALCSECPYLPPYSEGDIRQETPVEASFNADRARKMRGASDKWKSMKGTYDGLVGQVSDIEAQIGEIQSAIDSLIATKIPDAELKSTISVDVSIATVEERIKANNNEVDLGPLEEKIDNVRAQLDVVLRAKHFRETSKEVNERIAVLEKEGLVLKKRYSELSKTLSQCDKYVLTEIDVATKSLSKIFAPLEVRLVRPQLNGEPELRGDILFDGVSCATNACKGERYMADIVAVRALSRFYQAHLPVFIDDSESCTAAVRPVLNDEHQYFSLFSVAGKSLTVSINTN